MSILCMETDKPTKSLVEFLDNFAMKEGRTKLFY